MLESSRRKAFLWVALLALLLAIPLLVINQRPESLMPVISARFPSVQWIDVATLAEWMTRPAPDSPLVLDARSPEEFAVSHLKGARRVDPNRPGIESLGIALDRTVVVYCSVGYRSGAIAEKLEDSGFDEVYNLEGGIFAWANEGRPIFRGDGLANAVHPYDPFWARFLREDLRASRRAGE